MEKLGDVNFDLEELVEKLSTEEKLMSSDLYILFYQTCKKLYKRGREVYTEDNKNPVLYVTKKRVRLSTLKKYKLNRKNTLALDNLIRKYKNHDLQWGEILYILHGYIMIHRQDLVDCQFYYGARV